MFFCLTLLMGVGLFAVQNGKAGIAVAPLSYDFGTFKVGESRNHDFTVTNTGKIPLVLLSVKTSCTCTKVKWPKKPIKPGEKETITVTYNARDEGAFYKEIEVRNNSDKPVVVLRIKGIITK